MDAPSRVGGYMLDSVRLRTIYAELRHTLGGDAAAGDVIRLASIILRHYYPSIEEARDEDDAANYSTFGCLPIDEAFRDGGLRVLEFESRLRSNRRRLRDSSTKTGYMADSQQQSRCWSEVVGSSAREHPLEPRCACCCARWCRLPAPICRMRRPRRSLPFEGPATILRSRNRGRRHEVRLTYECAPSAHEVNRRIPLRTRSRTPRGRLKVRFRSD